MHHSYRSEVSPANTLYDSASAAVTNTGAQGKKKFAHFRRLFSSLNKKSHRRNGSSDSASSNSVGTKAPAPNTPADSYRKVFSGSGAARHAQHHESTIQKRLQQTPASSTVLMRRPSSVSSSSTASDDSAPVISDRAQGYILETYGLPVRTIGQGTGGFVKLHQACDGRYYAVKTFMFPDPEDKTKMRTTGMNLRQWKHMLDEASFSLSLRHPNVIRTYQFVREADGTVYSVMEYCEKDLFTVVQEGTLAQEDIDRLYYQLLQGIAYLHDAVHVAHRDLKLDNLCVDEDGNLKIIDFGCSSTFNPLAPSQTRGICGSDPYISPEVFSSPSTPYDPRKVDVWAAAVIYLAMVSGHFPWEVAKPEDPNYRLYLKYHGRVINHWLPKENPSNATIKRMLAISSDERPAIDELFKDDVWLHSLHARFSHLMDPAAVSSTAAGSVDGSDDDDAISSFLTRANSASTISSGPSISSHL